MTDREIKEQILKSYLNSIKDSWYAPTGYIFVTNLYIKSEHSKKWCKHTQNPDEYSWYIELLQEFREKYGDVQVVGICSDSNGKEWDGSEPCSYKWQEDKMAYQSVAVYVPIKTWLEVPFESD